jgi:hypothetical protein
MPDAPDRFTEAPAGSPGVTFAAAEPTEAYRPLSLLAVAGFVLAVGYALLVCLGGVTAFVSRYPRPMIVLTILVPLVAVLVGVSRRIQERDRLLLWAGASLAGLYALVGLAGLVAFSGTNPWVLPMGLMILGPICTALLCWMARSRIQASEDTLAGLGLANWGLLLSIFFGLNYAAYLTSNHFAVSQQASEFGSRWLELIQQDKLLDAFVMTLPPNGRPLPQRAPIELSYNTPRSARDQGPYTLFTRTPHVSLLRKSGPETRWELVSNSPVYEQNSYRVTLHYRITTKYGNFDLDLVAVGTESVAAGETGRGWFIPTQETLLRNLQPTEAGEQMKTQAEGAARVAKDFVDAMLAHDLDGAYRTTDTTQVSRAAFEKGSLVEAPPEEFWAPDKMRQDIPSMVRRTFQRDNPQQGDWTFPGGITPVGRPEGDRLAFRFPLALAFMDAGGTRAVVNAEVVVVSPLGPEGAAKGPWTVQNLNLLSAHGPPMQTPRPR